MLKGLFRTKKTVLKSREQRVALLKGVVANFLFACQNSNVTHLKDKLLDHSLPEGQAFVRLDEFTQQSPGEISNEILMARFNDAKLIEKTILDCIILLSIRRSFFRVLNRITDECIEAFDNIVIPENTGKKISVVTFNLANNNPHLLTIEQMVTKIFENNNRPDLLVFSLQEAKSSWSRNERFSPWYKQGENPAERILKRCIDEATSQLSYVILHQDNADAWTHPWYPHNWFHYARMHLVIAYKRTSFLPDQISLLHHGQRTTSERDHKGGLYALLAIDNITLGIIGVHLDSFNPDTAKQQAEDLMVIAQLDALVRKRPLDGIIIAGDFNTRLPLDALDLDLRTVRSRDSLIRRDLPLSNYIKESVDNWKRDSTQLNFLNFLTHNDVTYGEQDNLVLHPQRELYDIGALDHVAYVSTLFSVATEEATIARPLAPTLAGIGPLREVSDHAAVIGHLTLKPTTPEIDTKLGLLKHVDARQLDLMHQWLIDQRQPELFRNYFEYAIAATAPVDGHSLPYHLGDIDLIELDITFIIAHLTALLDQNIEHVSLYNRLIFGTCEKISRTQNNDPTFILEKFQQLIENPIGAGALNYRLLIPFVTWLDTHAAHSERKHFAVNSRNVFFSYSSDKKVAAIPKDQQKYWK